MNHAIARLEDNIWAPRKLEAKATLKQAQYHVTVVGIPNIEVVFLAHDVLEDLQMAGVVAEQDPSNSSVGPIAGGDQPAISGTDNTDLVGAVNRQQRRRFDAEHIRQPVQRGQ